MQCMSNVYNKNFEVDNILQIEIQGLQRSNLQKTP